MNLSKSLDFTQEFGRLFRWIFSVFAVNFVIYSLIRVVFYVWNFQKLENLGAAELFKVFLNGARFDLAVIFPIIFLIYLSLLLKPRFISKIIFGAIILSHTVILCGNFVDSELVHFVGRRFTKSTLYLIGEGQITNLMQYFWMTMITFFALATYLFFNLKILLKP